MKKIHRIVLTYGFHIWFAPRSLYSLITNFFMTWRLIKGFKSDIMLSACFDYDIMFSLSICIYSSCTNM